MKRLLLAGLVLPALILASCSSDEPLVSSTNDGNVTFTAKLPGTISRAYSDGLKATQLTYAVYDAETGEIIVKTGDDNAPVVSFSDLTATLSLDLVKGKTYDIVFWADVPENDVYTFDAESKTISIDYDGIKMGDENRDAFFQVEKGLAVNGAVSKSVFLRRPFAQLNWGTDDYDVAQAAKVNVKYASVSVNNVYQTLNLFTGLADDPTEVTYDVAELPGGNLTTSDGEYTYLAMDYLLTGIVLEGTDVQYAQSEVVDATLTVYDENNLPVNEVEVSNVPVQRNYRTNIYGSLLTSTVDYTIEINPDYFEGEHNQGLDVKEPQTDINGVYLITTAEELAYVAQNPTIWRDKTLKLMNNIDLQNRVWHPIGYNKNGDTSQNSMDWFEGTFDGNKKTISNFICSEKGEFAVAGLFGAVRGNIINLFVDNADIRSEHYAAALVAYSHQNNFSAYNGVDYPSEGWNITGCKVNNSTIVTTPAKTSTGEYDNGDKAGALIGYVNSLTTIENCDVRNNTIEGYRDLGGLVGYIGGTNSFQITIKGSYSISNTIKQQYAKGYKDVSKVYNHIGEVYGWCDKDPIIETGAHHSNTLCIYDMAPTNADELAMALRYAGEGTTITLGEYTYETYTGNPTFAQSGKNFKIKGAGQGKTVVNMSNYTLVNANVVMEDMTIQLPYTSYYGFSNYLTGEFNNIEFKGCLWTWGTEKVTYNNCIFDGSASDCYPLWIKYTADATLNNCKIISMNGRGILMCGDEDFNRIPNHDVTLNNCVFEVKDKAKDKAAFEIHTESDAENITGTIKLNNVEFPADKLQGGLWQEINNETEVKTSIFTIYVDGTLAQKGR